MILKSSSVNEAPRYPCKTCGMIFSTRVGLREHNKAHDAEGDSPNLGYGPVRRWRLPVRGRAKPA